MIQRLTADKYTIEVSQKGALTIGVILYTLMSGFAQPAPIITFDELGAGEGAGQGTFAVNINDFGQAIGYFIDANNVYHGFVRAPRGTLVTIDAPGAGAVPNSGQGTIAYSINIEGLLPASPRMPTASRTASSVSLTAVSSSSTHHAPAPG